MRFLIKLAKSILFAYIITGLLIGIAACFLGKGPIWNLGLRELGLFHYPLTVLTVTLFWGSAVYGSLVTAPLHGTPVQLPVSVCAILLAIFLLLSFAGLRKKTER